MANKLFIAAAGSGKTTHIVEQASEIVNESVLITTYTQANEKEIKRKIVSLNGCIPSNITIQTWFSLLIQHGVKPYQSYLYDKRVNGLNLVNQQSGFRYRSSRGFPVYFGEEDNFDRHYFDKSGKIYSDKLSKFVTRVNNESGGLVFDRLLNIYPNIFIDEVQDLAGYDLTIIKKFAEKANQLLLVGDPRQVTYLTHNPRKYKKYQNGLISNFIINECSQLNFIIDEDTLSHSYRCNQDICNFSNKLFPERKQSESVQSEITEHDGIFLVKKEKLNEYLISARILFA